MCESEEFNFLHFFDGFDAEEVEAPSDDYAGGCDELEALVAQIFFCGFDDRDGVVKSVEFLTEFVEI